MTVLDSNCNVNDCDVPLVNNIVDRCSGCNKNFTSNTSESLYQKQKLIQNSVRVMESLYTMNLGALNVYEAPNKKYEPVTISNTTYIVSPGVNWNQMSDRKQPHIQKVVTASGSTYGGNSTKRSIVRLRPGAMSPGGTGVDIKHNSYYRYLARLKGKGPLRQQTVPPLLPYIPFNPAFPVYGGKVFKTGLIAQCNYKNAC